MKTNKVFLAFGVFYLALLLISGNRILVNPRAVIWSDSEGYYKYLPAVFILKDFHKLDAGSVWPYYNDKGEYVDKYTCGVAYFQLPFFVAGHAVNQIWGGIKSKITITTYTPGQ